MTTETMRAAVEAALKELIEGVRPREPVTYAMAADVAIRTVLERLREPSLVMASAGRGALSEALETADWQVLARESRIVWQAMLDAAAREVG